MRDDPPTTWEELGLAQPGEDAPPGSIISVQSGRMLVRSYDGERSNTIEIPDDFSGRHHFDATYIPILESKSAPVVGDTIFYLGEILNDDSINLWQPTRVVWVGREIDEHVPVYSITDSFVTDRYIGEPCVPLHLLTDMERDVARDLAFTLDPASWDHSRVLLGIFECEWLIPTKRQAD